MHRNFALSLKRLQNRGRQTDRANKRSPPKRFDKPLVSNTGLDSLRRFRASVFGLQCIGRLEDRERGPEPNGRSNVGTRDQLPESRHCVGGQRPNIGPEPLRPK